MRFAPRISVLLIALLVLVGVPYAAPLKVLRFGDNPVDPGRADRGLQSGECEIETVGLQGPVTITAKKPDGTITMDTGMVPNGTRVIAYAELDRHYAKYIKVCGNDALTQWEPQGKTIRCADDGGPVLRPTTGTEAEGVGTHGIEDEPLGAPLSSAQSAELDTVQTPEGDSPRLEYDPAPTAAESWASRHPVASKSLYALLGAAVFGVACHNHYIWPCRDDEDDDDDGGSSSDDPPGDDPPNDDPPNDDPPPDDDDDDGECKSDWGGNCDDDPCSKGGCHDDDDN